MKCILPFRDVSVQKQTVPLDHLNPRSLIPAFSLPILFWNGFVYSHNLDFIAPFDIFWPEPKPIPPRVLHRQLHDPTPALPLQGRETLYQNWYFLTSNLFSFHFFETQSIISGTTSSLPCKGRAGVGACIRNTWAVKSLPFPQNFRPLRRDVKNKKFKLSKYQINQI